MSSNSLIFFLCLMVARSHLVTGKFLRPEYLNLVMELLNGALDNYISFEYHFEKPTWSSSNKETIKIYAPILIKDDIEIAADQNKIFTFHFYLPGGFLITDSDNYDLMSFDYCNVKVKLLMDGNIRKLIEVSLLHCDLVRFGNNGTDVPNPETYFHALSQVFFNQAVKYLSKKENKVELKTVQQVFEHVMRHSFPSDDYVVTEKEYTPSGSTEPTSRPTSPDPISPNKTSLDPEPKEKHQPILKNI